MASPSAWTAKAHGVTMSLSSGFGGRSNTRRYISEPTTRCPRPGLPSADTSASTTAEDHIRALTGRRPIRPTSPRCRMSRRLNPGRSSTYQTEEAVQTSGASTNLGIVIGRAKMNVFLMRAVELTEARPELAAAVEPLLKARKAVEKQIADLDRKVMQLARNDVQVRRFM